MWFEWAWFLIMYINAHGDSILNIYIFKGKPFKHNYIKWYENDFTMVMQLCAWMTTCLFSTWIFHFIVTIQHTQRQHVSKEKNLLIFNATTPCHGQYCPSNKESIIGLDHFAITYILHIVTIRFFCFKRLKTTFWAYIDIWT